MEKKLKNLQTFEQHTDKNLNISDVGDSSKSIAVDFAKWIADNKWYKQIRYDVWEKSGVGSKSTSELFDIFIENYH